MNNNEVVLKPEFKASKNKEYEVEVILDSIVYINA